jgi:ABC-2 type transport system ATP-binding protein
VAVELTGVTRRFGRTVAIDDVTFDARPGEVLGLLGPNGAGKTTTMRILTGSLRPHAGKVVVGGHDLSLDARAGQRLIGYMPETSALYPEMTVSSYLRHWAVLRGVPRGRRREAVGRVVKDAGLAEVRDRRVGTLSRGFRQRVGLAQALVHDPPVVVLDEPTAGLDPRQVADARALIARLGRRHTLVLSSHLLTEVSQLCRRVVVLDRGRVVTVDEVANLTAPVGPARLEVRVSGDLAAATAAVRGVEGVAAVDERGGLLVVTGDAADLGARVSAALVAAGTPPLELRRSQATTLEEAYLRLVSE